MPVIPAVIMAACGHLDEFVRTNVARVLDLTPKPYTFILIDDNSPDETGAFFDSVGDLVIHNADNYGLSYWRNQGLREATARGCHPIIQLDSDTQVREGWLEHSLAALEETGGWVVGMSGINVSAAPIYHARFRTNMPAGESATLRCPADYIQTCLWVAVGDIVDRVGYFDDIFHNWSGEDMDYGMRVWLKGGTCWQTYIPAFHPGGGSTVRGVSKGSYIYQPIEGRDERFIPDPAGCKWGHPYWASKWPESMAERYEHDHR